MKDILKEYIIKKYGKENFEEIIKKNYLNYIYTEEPHNVKLLLNKANVILLQNELIKICKKFNEQKIEYITFKGVVLSNRLYNNTYTRFFSDIDIFVFPDYFEKALNVLYDNGYNLRSPNTLNNNHHIALKNCKVILELHKSILNPFTQINESFMRDHFEFLNIANQKIPTFDITATLLHLIYHLYMDTYWVYKNLYHILTEKTFPTTGRFLFRAYEIALFSKKYNKEIKWEAIISDIKNQKLLFIFKIMITNILEIFPEAFPGNFTNTVHTLSYAENEWDSIYKNVLLSDKNDVNRLLCNYIDHYRNIRGDNNIHIKIGDSFRLIKKSENINNNKEMFCNISTQKTAVGIKLEFTVTDYDYCFSDVNNFDTLSSDGIHLILCSTEQYSYNSIFFFPKIINNEIKIVACDVLHNANKIIDEASVKTDFSEIQNSYIISVVFTDKFISENHMKNRFYIGLIASDCNPDDKRRANEIVLSEIESEWYNPIYFAEINMKHD